MNQKFNLPKPQINPDAMAKTLQDVKNMAAQKRNKNRTEVHRNPFSLFWSQRFAYIAVSFMVGIILSGSLLSSVAYSLPGSFLYPVKLISEKVAYTLRMTPSGRAELKIVFSQERLNELNRAYLLKGYIDKQLLFILLKDAQEALQISESLSSPKKLSMVRKNGILTQQTIQSLSLLEQRTTGNERVLVKSCREACKKRVVDHKACYAM